MNKFLRSMLLFSPKTYELLFKLKNSNWFNIYSRQIHEEDFKAFPLICDDRPQLFLDIGANVGMSARSIFRLKANARVVSFEPNPLTYSFLDKITRQFNNFEYHKIGLGAETDILDFYYPIYNGRKMTALGSFYYESAKRWINCQNVYWYNPQKLFIEKIPVEVKTLDSFNLNPDFIKIDVEGYQAQVLLGAKKTLERCLPILLIEGVNRNDLSYEILQHYGYSTFKFEKGKFYPNDFYACNNFFVPQEKLSLIQPYLAETENQVRQQLAV